MAELILKRFKKIQNLNRNMGQGISIGEGTTGQVYLVEDTENNNKLYALKIIDINSEYPKYRKDQIRNLVKREVNIMHQMDNSPNITRLHQTFQSMTREKSTFYHILEYCEGGNLQQYQAKFPNGVFTLDKAIDILTQVLVGLEHLHLKGYLHRHISPQNILVSKFDGKQIFKLSGFRYSKQQSQISGSVFGSPHYTSPEVLDCQIEEKREAYGFQVDMWAFGILFFTMLNGFEPFRTLFPERGKYPLSAKHLRKWAENFSYKSSVDKLHPKMYDQNGGRIYPLMENCTPDLEDLFKKMFDLNPEKRITFTEIKRHPVFAPRFTRIYDECKTSNIRQNKTHSLIDLKDKQVTKINAKYLQMEWSPSQINYTFNKQLCCLSDILHSILFFKKFADVFQNSDGLLENYEGFMISFHVQKYCGILLKNLKASLNQYDLHTVQPALRWNQFVYSNEFSKFQKLLDSHISVIELSLKMKHSHWEQYFAKICLINEHFGFVFTKEIRERAFEGKFKESYRKSSSYIYQLLVKKMKVRDDRKVNLLIAICMICHVYNQLFSNKDRFTSIFSDFFTKKKEVHDKICYFDLREWIMKAQASQLKKITISLMTCLS